MIRSDENYAGRLDIALAAAGSLGTAAATVDLVSEFVVTYTGPAEGVVTLPNPTSPQTSTALTIHVSSAVASTQSFTVLGRRIQPGRFAEFTFNVATSTWFSDSELGVGNGLFNTVFARGFVDIGDPANIGALPIDGASYNVASATGLDGNVTAARVQINFINPAPNANYVVSGSVRSKVAGGYVNDSTVSWTVVSKSTSGFVVVFRESTGFAQALWYDFTCTQETVISLNTTPLITGNITAVGEKLLSQQGVLLDATNVLQMRWNATTDTIQIATTSGTRVIDYTTSINFGVQSTVINGGGGIDGSPQATPVTVTTTWATIGDAGITGIEDRVYNIWVTTGEHYRVNVIRKGTTIADGWCSFIVEKIGVASGAISQQLALLRATFPAQSIPSGGGAIGGTYGTLLNNSLGCWNAATGIWTNVTARTQRLIIGGTLAYSTTSWGSPGGRLMTYLSGSVSDRIGWGNHWPVALAEFIGTTLSGSIVLTPGQTFQVNTQQFSGSAKSIASGVDSMFTVTEVPDRII